MPVTAQRLGSQTNFYILSIKPSSVPSKDYQLGPIRQNLN